MQDVSSAWLTALGLVFSGDADLFEIIGLSLTVSLTAVAISCALGIPLGALLAISRFRGRTACLTLVNALMGLPPVVVGLVVYLGISRSGPLGTLGLLYTPTAMIIAQVILILPIVIALSRQILEDLYTEYADQLRSLSISRRGIVGAIIQDGRFGLMTVALAGFGRAIAEVGAVMIVGGNIDHLTRVMTTAIALETSKGDLAMALALGLILLVLAFSVNAAVMALRTNGEARVYA